MIRTVYIFFVGMLLITSASVGQQKKLDSLLTVLAASKEDTFKVKTLLELTSQYKNADTIRIFAEQAIKLSEKLNYVKGQALAYKAIGTTYYQKKDALTLENWNKALDLYKSINDSSGQARILGNIGAVYMNQADDLNATKYFMGSLALAEKINDTLLTASAMNNMGTVYKHKESTIPKALENYRGALGLLERVRNKNGIGTTNSNIGEVYMEKRLYDSAIYFFNKSMIAHEGTERIAIPLMFLGTVYDSLKNYPEAIKYHLKADSIGKQFGNKRYQMLAQLGLASAYLKSDNKQKSFQAFKNAENIATETHANLYLKQAYQGLSKYYADRRDYQQAFTYQQLLTTLKDTLYSVDSEKQLGNVVFNYEIDKKQSEINLLTKDKALADLELNRQKFAKNALIAGLGLVSLIIFILYRDYLNKARTNKLLDSQKAQIQTLLSNILPDEVAQELQRDGFATPKFYESASVLFTDFKSFTKHADHMTPQEVIAELNSCFIAFDDIMEKYNLEKIKTIGDAYMCAGGIPVPDPNHYWNMVKAAKDIQATIVMRNNERVAKGLPPWEIRIGIHVGPIVAGVVGKKKYAYDIWGSTVNIASRMESNGEPGQINISAATYELIKDEYECTHRGKIYAKNVGDIDMYFLGDKIKKREAKQENMPILVG